MVRAYLAVLDTALRRRANRTFLTCYGRLAAAHTLVYARYSLCEYAGIVVDEASQVLLNKRVSAAWCIEPEETFCETSLWRNSHAQAGVSVATRWHASLSLPIAR